MKNFEDFPGLSEESLDNVLGAAADALGIECDDQNASVPINKLLPFVMLYSNLNAMALLSKYHEWVNSDLSEQ